MKIGIWALCMVVLHGSCAWGGTALPDKERKTAPQASGKPPMVRQTMKMDEPMTIRMMKEGTRKGDVRRSAGMKEKEMEPAMAVEEDTMPSREKGR